MLSLSCVITHQTLERLQHDWCFIVVVAECCSCQRSWTDCRHGQQSCVVRLISGTVINTVHNTVHYPSAVYSSLLTSSTYKIFLEQIHKQHATTVSFVTQKLISSYFVLFTSVINIFKPANYCKLRIKAEAAASSICWCQITTTTTNNNNDSGNGNTNMQITISFFDTYSCRYMISNITHSDDIRRHW